MIRTAERRRSLQDERCEDTRARLLEATLESLVAVGYARTSTTEIAERAGVSRGAQVYHYPTKAALVAAAVEHLLERRYQELQQLFAERLPRAGGPGAAIGLLWRMFEKPTFAAWLEFVVASRTDPESRAAGGPAKRAIRQFCRRISPKVSPGGGLEPGAAETGPRLCVTRRPRSRANPLCGRRPVHAHGRERP